MKNKSRKILSIPIADELLELLELNRNDTQYIFVNPKTNKPYTDDNIADAFKDACNTANINNFRFHDLRHTAGTRLLEVTADIIAVKEILGHSSVLVTQRYAHTEMEKKRKEKVY